MEAKELRIGNLVNINRAHGRGEKQIKVKEINLNYLSQLEMKCTYIEPIPITEEWLLNFGFNKNPDNWFQINYFTDCQISAEKMGLFINLISNRCCVLDTDCEDASCVMTAKRIYYVHELQNLYYTLTKTELNYE